MAYYGDDPGWRRSRRHALLALIPGFLALQLRKSREGEGLVVLRGLFLSFVLGVMMIGVVVAILDLNTSSFGTVSEPPVVLGVLGVGVLSIIGPLAVGRTLECGDDERLVKSYVQRFFLRIAFAELPALAGFVGFMVSSAGWMYLVGAAFSIVGFVRLAPTADHLRRDQDDLREKGCHRQLVLALQHHSPRGR